MDSCISTRPAQSGARGEAFNQLPSPSGKPIQVELEGRVWSLDARLEQLVRPCLVCDWHLGRHTLCSRIYHRVCISCHQLMLRTFHPISCPLCNVSKAECFLRAQDLKTRAKHNDTLVSCTDCNNWSGPLNSIGKHIRACNVRDYSCPNALFGCDWKGPQSQVPIHEPECDKALPAFAPGERRSLSRDRPAGGYAAQARDEGSCMKWTRRITTALVLCVCTWGFLLSYAFLFLVVCNTAPVPQAWLRGILNKFFDENVTNYLTRI